MHPQLQSVTDEFAAAQERLHALAVSMPEESWAKRAEPARWSVGECVAHLNLTAEAYLPLVRRGIEEGAGPPVRHRVGTTAPFVPAGSEPRAHTLEHFDRLQAEQVLERLCRTK